MHRGGDRWCARGEGAVRHVSRPSACERLKQRSLFFPGYSYWSGASKFLAVYDPAFDTFEECVPLFFFFSLLSLTWIRDLFRLCLRSPFSISAMCFVGSRIRDGGGSSLPLHIFPLPVADSSVYFASQEGSRTFRFSSGSTYVGSRKKLSSGLRRGSRLFSR